MRPNRRPMTTAPTMRGRRRARKSETLFFRSGQSASTMEKGGIFLSVAYLHTHTRKQPDQSGCFLLIHVSAAAGRDAWSYLRNKRLEAPKTRAVRPGRADRLAVRNSDEATLHILLFELRCQRLPGNADSDCRHIAYDLHLMPLPRRDCRLLFILFQPDTLFLHQSLNFTSCDFVDVQRAVAGVQDDVDTVLRQEGAFFRHGPRCPEQDAEVIGVCDAATHVLPLPLEPHCEGSRKLPAQESVGPVSEYELAAVLLCDEPADVPVLVGEMEAPV